MDPLLTAVAAVTGLASVALLGLTMLRPAVPVTRPPSRMLREME